MILPQRARTQNESKLDQAGFTLVELVIIIVTLGILAAVAIPKFTDLSESSRITATKKEMAALKGAIVGNADALVGGKYVDRGFEGDVGHLPSLLQDLVTKPDSVSSYDRLTGIGWNGPYIDSTDANYLKDSWDSAYVYEPSSRSITSVGGSEDIVVSF